jgi:hypothetical protein
MHRLIRSALALCAVAAFTACSKGAPLGPADSGPTVCETLADCPGNFVCLKSSCVPICHSNAECASPQVCEEGICLAPACGSDGPPQCGSGQICQGGKCASAPVASQVASCTVTPSPGQVHVNAGLQMKAVAQDADGKPLHFGPITWSATAGATIDTQGLLSATAPGDITVTATAGSKTCQSTVHSYGDAPAGTLHVTVINMHSKEPVAGAKVVIDSDTTALVTAADGTTGRAAAAGPHDVHVFAGGYNYTSFIQTTATDLLVPLAPYVQPGLRSGFASRMCETRASDPNTGDAGKPQCASPEGEFKWLQDQGEFAHMAFFGSGIPNSLLDLSLDTLVGPLHTVHLSLPGTSTAKDVSLPYGLVLGIGANFFGTNDPRVFADPGVRALWGIGGNVNLAQVLRILTPLIQPNATVDIGTLLPQLLGFFGKMEAGAVVGVQAPPNATGAPGSAPTFQNKPVQLTTPMRLRLDATSPNLPQVDGAYMDGVLAVVGAMDYPLGFVPLGLTAGLSAKDGTGKVLDPTCDTSGGPAPCATNKLPIKFAPENGGTEGSPIGVALLAVNFGGFAPNSATHVAVSGQVQVLSKVDYVAPPGAAPAITVPAFLTLPTSSSIVVTRSSRTVRVTGDADSHVQIYRFELENAARQSWNIWMGPVGTSRTVMLPNPADFNDAGSKALIDPFADAPAGSGQGPTARLLGLQFFAPDDTKTAAQLESFSTLRLDELGTALRAFTALQVDVAP